MAEPIGLAATDDPELVESFVDIARQEYLAIGTRVAIHPMADLATEPRWSRISGTLGEDVELAARMIKAAFEANTAQIIPYYGVTVGLGYEGVGFAYNTASRLISEVFSFSFGISISSPYAYLRRSRSYTTGAPSE
jgi:hypothetical protein